MEEKKAEKKLEAILCIDIGGSMPMDGNRQQLVCEDPVNEDLDTDDSE